MTLVTGKPNSTAATRLGAGVGTKNKAAFVAIAYAKKLDKYYELERRKRDSMLMLPDA